MITIATSQIPIVLAGRSTTPALAQLRASDPSLYTLCIALHRPNQIPTLTTKRSCAATPSINALNRVGCPRAPHRRRSNPHRARCTIASHFPRFRPLEGFVRRPPECLAPSVRGRHPKPFTTADSCSAEKNLSLDHLVGNRKQRRGYVEAAAVTDVDPTARPSAA
jgi:hypothetical protein